MTIESRTLREGSAQKRAAILDAARELFLTDGFDRSSVDAVAARARVSKRTVYDYFGDKRALLLAVVEQALSSLMERVGRAVDEDLAGTGDLEASLIAFARSITVSAIGSSDYAALMRLLSMESANLPELRNRKWPFAEPEELVAERFAEFAREGLLSAPDPRLAADHFVALTLLPGANGLGQGATTDAADRVIVEGVRAFLRAYAPDPAP